MIFFLTFLTFFKIKFSLQKHNNIIYPKEKDVPTLLDQYPISLFIYLHSRDNDSKQFKLIFQRLALIMEKKKPDLPIFSIMCTDQDQSSFCQDEHLVIFPTIRLHYQEEILQYEGNNTLIDIFMWLKSRLIKPFEAMEELSVEQLKKLLLKEQIVYLYFKNIRQETEQDFNEFKMLSTINQTVHFYITEKQSIYNQLVDVCKEMINNKLNFKTNITIFQPDHKKCYYYGGSRDYKQQQQFLNSISKHSIRYFDEFSLTAAEEHNLPIMIWFVEDDNKDPFSPIFEQIAEIYHENMLFCIVNSQTYQGRYQELQIFKDQEVGINQEVSYIPIHNLMVDLGIEKSTWPQLFIINEDLGDKIEKWKYKGNYDQDNVMDFILRVLKNEELQHIPVQTLKTIKKLNEQSKYEHISVLNYDKKIKDKKNVIIWIEGSYELCEECEELFGEFDEAIEELKQEHEEIKNLKFFRLNVQLNEFTKFKVNQVPQLITWDREKNMHILFENIHKETIKMFLVELLDYIEELPDDDLQIILLNQLKI